MNKRIKTLAEQASTTTTSYYDGRGNVTETFFDKDKFAQLIVIKCLDIVDKKVSGMVGVAAMKEIEEYFGVKE